MACLARCLALFICCTTSLSSHFSRRSNLNELLLASAIEVLQLQKEQTKKNERRFLIEVQMLFSYCINNSFIENKDSISKGAFTPRYSSSEWSVCAVSPSERDPIERKGGCQVGGTLGITLVLRSYIPTYVDGGNHLPLCQLFARLPTIM